MGAAVAPLMGAQATWTLLLLAEQPGRVRVEFREEPKIAGAPTQNHRIWVAVEDCAGARVPTAD